MTFVSSNPHRGLATAGLLAPAVAFLGVWFLWPLLHLFLMGVGPEHSRLTAYSNLAANEIFRSVLFYTIQVSFIVTIVCLAIAIPTAFTLTKLKGAWLTVALYCVLVPFWVSVLVRTFGWMLLLERNGPVNGALVASGLVEKPIQMLFTSFSVYVGMVHVLLPYAVMPIYSAMLRVDERLIRASEGLGASPLTTLRRVYFPAISGGIAAAAALVMLISLGFYITPALLGGRKNMMVASLIDDFINTRFNWASASAAAFLLLLTTLLILALASRFVAPSAMVGRR